MGCIYAVVEVSAFDQRDLERERFKNPYRKGRKRPIANDRQKRAKHEPSAGYYAAHSTISQSSCIHGRVVNTGVAMLVSLGFKVKFTLAIGRSAIT